MIKSEDEDGKQPREAAAVQDEAPRKRASRRSPRAGAAPDDGPDPWAAKLERAEQLESAGSHVDAAEAFQAVAAAQPDNLRAALGLGSALAAQGKYDPAEKELRRALKLAPE